MLTVVLGRTTPVYGPRETLTGDVVFTSPTACRILDLRVNFYGESRVGFLISSGEGRTRIVEKVEETDIHLDVLHPLIKNYRGLTVDGGVHTYPFSLKLPPLLPSSYSSQYGHIDFHVDVTLQTSTGSFVVRKPFVVKAPVNILLFPVSQSPQSAQVSKRYGLVSHKTLRLKASVFKTCLEPGDFVSVFIETRNETLKQLKYLFCTLKKTWKSIGRQIGNKLKAKIELYFSQIITTVLVHLPDGSVDRVTKENLKTEAHEVTSDERYYSWHCQLVTPSLLTPTIAASTIVFVTYSIQVSVKLKRVTIAPEVEIPVVFGTRTPISSQRNRGLSESCTDISSNSDNNTVEWPAGGPRRRSVTFSIQPTRLRRSHRDSPHNLHRFNHQSDFTKSNFVP